MITLEGALQKDLELVIGFTAKARNDALIASATPEQERYERLMTVDAAYDNLSEAMRYVSRARTKLMQQVNRDV